MIGFNKYLSTFFVAIAVTTALVSCSIKEDRAECPCWLTLNYDSLIRTFDYTRALVTVVSNQVVVQENVDILPLEGIGSEYSVPRRENIAACAVGHENLWWSGDTLTVPTGLEWGKVFLDAQHVDCSGDLAYAAFNVHKEYCQINFILVGLNDTSTYPFDIRVRANCNGIRMRDRKPVHGAFTAYAQPENTAELFRVRIPRQEANEMTMDLLYKNPDHEYTEDDLLTTFDLGKAFSSVGYNWGKEDLDDMYISVDFVLGTYSIKIVPWSEDEITVRY